MSRASRRRGRENFMFILIIAAGVSLWVVYKIIGETAFAALVILVFIGFTCEMLKGIKG